ncbi:hypothetical protein [Desertibacillus haloalkaliphilus]|uniref:hypothetical protein n=1 Tax=Desertibacillus haloalkaliphilus TaxID=1328930 RepID=UPI001C268EDD|nr:hypothetical protein [Desertibacillus haloalkaliphilus]MBU8908247.1 hypothetical protein [Desertibacillus haloalkaliphilus]
MDSEYMKDVAKHLNEISWKTLDVIDRNENVTYLKLLELLSISKNLVHKEIARLEGAVLITTERNPLDNRSFYYHLTNYGEQILAYKDKQTNV